MAWVIMRQPWQQFRSIESGQPAVASLGAEIPEGHYEPAETAMNRELAWSWPAELPGEGRPDPVFLFAWPGSGPQPSVARTFKTSRCFGQPRRW